jgi:signal transduction histidine kinase
MRKDGSRFWAHVVIDPITDSMGELVGCAKVTRAASRGATLTQQLLTFARQQPFQPERVRVNRVIDSFEAVLRRAVKSSMQLELQLSPGLPEIMADVPQLASAVLNLVVNARDAIGDTGTIVIASSLRSEPEGGTLPAGNYVCLSVRDNGCGMPPEVIARAVEPFFTTKEVGKGAGLGLSDVVMPGMTGVALAKAARQLRPEMKVILSSGYMAAALSEQKEGLAQFGFIGKP